MTVHSKPGGFGTSVWGDEIVLREDGIPFLVYKDRPRAMRELFAAC